MSVCRKLPDGTIQKIAGHTILLDANASEVRQGRWNLVSTGVGWVEQNIIFTDPMPDNDYIVIIESDAQTWAMQPGPYRITNKTTTGFTLASFNDNNAAGQVNMNMAGTYTAFKPVKIEGYTALQNKVNNPDETPTIDSMNLVTSDGVARAIKDAGAIWKGTRAEWDALPLAEKKGYDLAALTDAGYILAVDRTDGAATETANLNKIFKGTQAEWDALTTAQKNYYEIAHIDGHDDRTYGAVTDVVKKGDMRAVTSNAVFQERARGMVPDGVSIDDMIGPEWVGTWNVKPETPGHKPYIKGNIGYLDTWMYLEVKYYPSGTEQVIRVFDETAYARRFCPEGSSWLNASDTMLSGHTYGGWYTYYPSGAVVRGLKNYGAGLNGCLVQMGFSYGQPYLTVYNNENPKVAGQSFVFAQVPSIQRAFWEWGHFPDEVGVFGSGALVIMGGLGLDVCVTGAYGGLDSLWLGNFIAVPAGKLYAKVCANGVSR